MTSTEKPLFRHKAPIQKRFSDIDSLGHATNSVYQQYFDIGKMQYFEDVLKEQMDWNEEGLIMVSITLNYLSQVQQYDSIEVRTKVVRLGNKSLEMLQQVFNLTSNAVAAEGKSVMVAYSGKTAQSIPIPERWRKRMIDFEGDVEL
jgi:acyl-CoA thioester hydrolase